MLYYSCLAVAAFFVLSLSLQSASYEIRNYNPSKDFPTVMDLCKNLWKQADHTDQSCSELAIKLYKIAFQERLGAVPYQGKILQSDDGTIIAFALYEAPIKHPFTHMEFYRLAHDRRIAQLSFIIVNPAHDNKGYNLLLLYAIEKDLLDQGFSILVASIKDDNDHVSVNWYKKEGFAAVQSSADSQTALEEALRQKNDHFGYMLMSLSLRKVPSNESGLPLVNLEQRYIKMLLGLEEKKQKIPYTSKRIIARAFKAFIDIDGAPSVQPAELMQVMVYYFSSKVTKDEAYHFAAYIAGQKTINRQLKKYLSKAIDFIAAHYSILEDVKEERNTVYPASFLGTPII